MIKILAKSLSWLFHPLIMTTAGIVVILFTDSYVSYIPLQAKRMLILLTAIGTLILPALLVPLFLLQGKVSNIEMDDRRERLYPLALTSIFYLLTFILFLKIPVFKLIHGFMLGSLLSVLAGFLISLKWKISTHMIGLGGLTALMVLLSFKLDVNLIIHLIITVIAAGFAGSSRLYLKAHEEMEVLAGFLAGILIMSTSIIAY